MVEWVLGLQALYFVWKSDIVWNTKNSVLLKIFSIKETPPTLPLFISFVSSFQMHNLMFMLMKGVFQL